MTISLTQPTIGSTAWGGAINQNWQDLQDALTGARTIGPINFDNGSGMYLRLPTLTTAQRNALTPANGMMIYNSDTTQLESYKSSSWGALGSGGISGSLTSGKMPKATGASTVSDSNLSDTGSLLGGYSSLSLRSGDQFGFSSSSSDPTVAADSGLGRDTAAVIKITDGSSGKGWLSNRAGFVRKTSDQVVNNSTTLTDLTDLSVTLLAGRNYQFRGVLFTNTAVAASGLRVAITGTATFTDLRYMIQIWDLFTRSLGSVSVLNVLGTAVFKTTISAVNNCILIDGCCTVNAGGTLKVQGAQGTADASDTTFRRGSYLHVEDVP